jgi:hypothetical protein
MRAYPTYRVTLKTGIGPTKVKGEGTFDVEAATRTINVAVVGFQELAALLAAEFPDEEVTNVISASGITFVPDEVTK